MAQEDSISDLVREYEMIWTLFHSPEEEEEARKRAGVEQEDSRNQDGIVMRILKYIFHTDHDQDESYPDCDSYTEKKPYHNHIHQPSTRPRPEPTGSPDGEGRESSAQDYRRLHPDSALVARPPLRPDEFPPQPPLSEQSIPFFPEKIYRLLYTLAVGAGIIAISSAISVLNLIMSFLSSRWK